MELLGRRCNENVHVYFTGGATAIFFGWRENTIDVDIRLLPDSDAILRIIPAAKEELNLNIELACPSDFIPELPGWQGRSLFIEANGSVCFSHYDPYAQALAKIERGHSQDVEDIQSLLKSGLVRPERLLELFGQIEGLIYKYPAIDPKAFRRAVEDAVFK